MNFSPLFLTVCPFFPPAGRDMSLSRWTILMVNWWVFVLFFFLTAPLALNHLLTMAEKTLQNKSCYFSISFFCPDHLSPSDTLITQPPLEITTLKCTRNIRPPPARRRNVISYVISIRAPSISISFVLFEETSLAHTDAFLRLNV